MIELFHYFSKIFSFSNHLVLLLNRMVRDFIIDFSKMKPPEVDIAAETVETVARTFSG